MNDIIHFMKRCEGKFDVNKRRPDQPGCTLITMSAWRNMLPVIKHLDKIGSDPNTGCRKNDNPAFGSITNRAKRGIKGAQTTAKYMAGMESLDLYLSRNNWKNNPFVYAIGTNNYELVQILVKQRKGDPTIPRPGGKNLYQYAKKVRASNKIKKLLKPYF